MNKKGFTLTELLVVIAIIGILSVIIIPSVVKINQSINEREYEQRKIYIQNAAELYASDKPDIFQGGDTAYIYVWQLITENYLNPDLDGTDDICNYYTDDSGRTMLISESEEEAVRNSVLSTGCVSDPVNQSSLNSKRVKVTRKTVGIVAELEFVDTGTPDGSSELLVKKVCDAISGGSVVGRYAVPSETDKKECECVTSGNDVTGLVKKGTTTQVDSCILVSPSDQNGNVNNWLKYGSSSANWRVVGLYKLDNEIVAKMITSSVVD